jgi:general stress protein CsbA
MLLELNLLIRLALLVFLSLLTIRYSARGLHSGIVLLLVTSMLPVDHRTLISGGSLPNLTVDRVIWPLVFLSFVWQWRQGNTKRCTVDMIEWCMFILLFVVMLSMYFHGSYIAEDIAIDVGLSDDKPFSEVGLRGDKLQFSSVLSAFFLPFLSYFIMRRAVLSEAQVRSFFTGVGLITVYLGFTGVGEAWQQGWLVFPKYILDPKQGIHFGQVRGPFVQASWNGLAMAMGLPVLLWLLFNRRDRTRWVWLVGVVLIGASLPYVFQRAAWLCAMTALAVVVLTWPKRRSALKLHCALIGGVLLCTPIIGFLMSEDLATRFAAKLGDEQNIDYRFDLIQASAQIAANNLLTGIGFDKIREEFLRLGLDEGYSSHNTMLTLFTELGLLGFLPYLFIFGRLFFESTKAYLLLPASRTTIGVLWGITGAYLIMSLAVELRGVAYVHVLLFALWGMLLEIMRRQCILRQELHAGRRRVANFHQPGIQPFPSVRPIRAWRT